MKKFVDRFAAMDTQKAIELIEKSEHVGILLSSRPSLDAFASAEATARLLRSREKKVGLLSPAVGAAFPSGFPRSILVGSKLTREFVVSLDTQEAPVSQMRYEKREGAIDIIFSPHSLEIEPKFVSFNQGKIICDLILALGVSDIEALNGSISVTPEFFTETPIINIDSSSSNQKYGEVNLVDEQCPAISELVYRLLTSYREGPLDNESATLILAGIFSETQCLRSPRTRADTLLAASELVRLGAGYAGAFEIITASRPLELVQLFGRAAVRSKKDAGAGILWSFLTAEDFEKTSRSPQDASAVLSHLEDQFSPQRLISLLWQDPDKKTVQAMLSGERTLLSAIKGVEPGEFQSPHLKLTIRFSSFREGEEFINSLLARVL